MSAQIIAGGLLYKSLIPVSGYFLPGTSRTRLQNSATGEGISAGTGPQDPSGEDVVWAEEGIAWGSVVATQVCRTWSRMIHEPLGYRG